MLNRVDSTTTGTGAGKWHPWADFLVEVFGSLVPGLVFIAAMVVILGCPLVAIVEVVSGHPLRIAMLQQGQLLQVFTWEFLIVGFCMAYVCGHIFFRQDPKETDKASFRRLQKTMRRGCSDKSSVIKKLRNEYACDSTEECNFPYLHLGRYLENRGLNHLMWFITWDENPERRSKVYINLLKVRLMMHAPEKCGAIARNEAHVRLMSSTWHLCQSLIYASLSTILAYVLSVGVLQWAGQFHDGHAQFADFLPLLPAVLVLVSAFLARRAIEVPFHYQRLREIIFVLETAQTLFIDTPELLTVDGVFPKFGADSNRPAAVDNRIPRCFASGLAKDQRCSHCSQRVSCN